MRHWCTLDPVAASQVAAGSHYIVLPLYRDPGDRRILRSGLNTRGCSMSRRREKPEGETRKGDSAAQARLGKDVCDGSALLIHREVKSHRVPSDSPVCQSSEGRKFGKESQSMRQGRIEQLDLF